MSTRRYVVDRLEAGTAIVVTDGQEPISVPVRQIPLPIREGAVIRVRVDEAGCVVWSSAKLDEAERLRLEKDAQDTLDRLRDRDPGGDITT